MAVAVHAPPPPQAFFETMITPKEYSDGKKYAEAYAKWGVMYADALFRESQLYAIDQASKLFPKRF